MKVTRTRFGAALISLALACGEVPAEDPPAGPGDQTEGPKTDGGSPGAVDSAREKYPDLPTYFERSVQRTCSPNFGVCHRSRQYPDMTTAANFVKNVGQRCNLLRDDPLTIDNICEPVGDTLEIRTGTVIYQATIGNARLFPEGSTVATATAVEIALKQALPQAFPLNATVAVLRSSPGLPTLSLPLPASVLQTAAASDKVVLLNIALLRNALVVTGGARWTDFLVPAKLVPGSPQQLVAGDPNRDGVYGAELDGREIKPGDPAASYLYLRMIAPLASPSRIANMNPQTPVVESQMPLANFDYWDIDNAAYAMYCWIKGLKVEADGSSNALGKIDYNTCGELPEGLRPRRQGGEARTWSGIWMNVLATSCATAGCHDRATRAASLDMSDPQRAYAALWNKPSTQVNDPGVKLIYPFNPDQSYLVQKLRGTASVGERMPLGRELPERDKAIEAITTWINQGARDN